MKSFKNLLVMSLLLIIPATSSAIPYMYGYTSIFSGHTTSYSIQDDATCLFREIALNPIAEASCFIFYPSMTNTFNFATNPTIIVYAALGYYAYSQYTQKNNAQNPESTETQPSVESNEQNQQ